MISWSKFSAVGNEEKYLLDALSSGWLSGGDYVLDLEDALTSTFSTPKAYAVSSGTSALQLAYQTLDVTHGDEVVIPAFCFQAAANVAIQLGLRPVFCDVDEETWNQTVETIEQVITNKTVGIVVVHNYGVSAQIQQICKYAAKAGLWVIEDCAEAWFSKRGDRYVGQFGDISTFSMHATKTIACGEGGVILINDEALIDRAALIRSHGLARQNRHYYHELPGNNYRLSNLLCAVALAQLEKRHDILQDQRRNYRVYQELLRDHWAVRSQKANSGGAQDEVWANAVCINFDELEISRDELIELLACREIEIRPGFYSASCLPYLSQFEAVPSTCANHLAENVIVLPTNASIEEGEARTVCTEIIEVINSSMKGR